MDQLREIKRAEMNIRKYEFRCFRNILNREQLYKGDPMLLMYVASHDGRKQNEIAKVLCVKPASLTVMVKRMEQAGLIVRRPDEKDMRISRVFISEKGKEMSRRTDQLFEKIVKEIYRGISREDLDTYYSVLKAMEQNLERMAGSFSRETSTTTDRSEQKEC